MINVHVFVVLLCEDDMVIISLSLSLSLSSTQEYEYLLIFENFEMMCVMMDVIDVKWKNIAFLCVWLRSMKKKSRKVWKRFFILVYVCDVHFHFFFPHKEILERGRERIKPKLHIDNDSLDPFLFREGSFFFCQRWFDIFWDFRERESERERESRDFH